MILERRAAGFEGRDEHMSGAQDIFALSFWESSAFIFNGLLAGQSSDVADWYRSTYEF